MTTPVLDPSGKFQRSFNGATHNTTALAVTTTDANDVLVLIVCGEPNSTSAVSVSTVTNTGTASLTWAKQAGLSWRSLGGGINADQACIEIWYAEAPLAGTYNITCTFNQTVDGATLVGFGVNGSDPTTPWDPGTTASTTGSATNPAISGLTSTNNDLFVIAVDSAGVSSENFGAAPTGYTILDQTQNGAGTNWSTDGSYYNTTSSGLSAATITTNDTHTGGFGSKVWGMLVVALTSDSGSTTHSVSLTESMSLTDTVSEIHGDVTSLSESISLSDSVSATIVSGDTGVIVIIMS